MKKTIIKNATIVNENQIWEGDLLIQRGRIEKIGGMITVPNADEINAEGKILLPGIIDDQVHFREPGLTHKATIYSESKAAVAGGVTSYMEMPNTSPPALTHALLEDKYRIAQVTSLANFSFYLGASAENIEEIKATDPGKVCGIKIFMGSSTGNLLVDNPESLEAIFRESPTIITTHCEDEATIRHNTALFQSRYGERAGAFLHPLIRSREACIRSSDRAIEIARKYQSRLHILHITTAEEVQNIAEAKKSNPYLTAEVCVHHLHFSEEDYAQWGNFIKCNPAIKTSADRDALWRGLLNDSLDVVATDHAPHTREEKEKHYWEAPSGLPLIQHSLPLMLEKHAQGMISLEKIVEKMAHKPAQLFRVLERGYIREGYFADLVLADLHAPWTVKKEDLKYKCKWSPLEQTLFSSKVTHTWVNGHLVWKEGRFDECMSGQRLGFLA